MPVPVSRVLSCVALFPHIFLLPILSFGRIVVSKHERKSDREAKRNYKIMSLDEKIIILTKLRGVMSAAAVGLTFR
jgi:hypothetical protein